MMEQQIVTWRTPRVAAAAMIWCLVVVLPATAQEANEPDAELSPPAVEPASATAPSRPPVDPALEPQLREAMQLIQDSEWAQAGEMLKALYEASPDNPDVRRNYSLYFIHLDDPDTALELLQPLIGTPYADFVVLNNAAWLYATNRDPQKRNSGRALELAQEALLLMPTNYHIWSTLAEAHYAGGQFDKALKASREARRLAGRANASSSEAKEIVEQAEKIEKAVAALALIE